MLAPQVYNPMRLPTLLLLAVGRGADGRQPPQMLKLRSFGGVADGSTNNQRAFKAAFAHCDTLSHGCVLELPPSAPGVPTVYRTSAINLTSNLNLLIPPNVSHTRFPLPTSGTTSISRVSQRLLVVPGHVAGD